MTRYGIPFEPQGLTEAGERYATATTPSVLVESLLMEATRELEDLSWSIQQDARDLSTKLGRLADAFDTDRANPSLPPSVVTLGLSRPAFSDEAAELDIALKQWQAMQQKRITLLMIARSLEATT